ncbi:MAG: DUF1223 domain-containing protein [Pseudomonadota bacterium]
MHFVKALALCLPFLCAAPSWAEGNKVVVELFTSQGCSSCPPADRLMAKLADRDEVIALSLHVDYWDYIGWKDQFADPAYTARQKAYAHRGGRNMVYTPQMIINGTDQVVGARAMELADLIAAHAALERPVAIEAVRDGNRVMVTLSPIDPDLSGGFDLQLVRYSDARTIEITRGENAGRTLTYHHVVDGWETVADWDGASVASLEFQLDDDRPVVILVQQQGPGPIVAAAELD